MSTVVDTAERCGGVDRVVAIVHAVRCIAACAAAAAATAAISADDARRLSARVVMFVHPAGCPCYSSRTISNLGFDVLGAMRTMPTGDRLRPHFSITLSTSQTWSATWSQTC